MTKLQRRLKKLEGQLTDDAGLVPHSARWRAYWIDRIDRILSDTDTGTDLIPLEALDALLHPLEG